MLTPRFKLSQDENHVFIVVHAPYTNIGETEIDIDGENFLFVSSPYFLRLRLPGKIVDNESSKGSYTCDSGDFSLTFDKVTPGELFENLDMITSLLAPRDIPDMNPDLIEMLDEDGISFEDNEDVIGDKYTYGFANKISNEFKSIGSEFPQIFELREPENFAIGKRNQMRIQYEDEKFSADHYLADLYEDELIAPYLNATFHWEEKDLGNVVEFTEDEISVLKELPNKHYLLSKTERNHVLLGLIDIMYGYCYDKRTTLNDSTVESGWTINKLSSTLSWFCVFDNVKDVLVACYRRALVFPIFRNFDLCEKVKSDLIFLLRKGRKLIIKCFIEVHQIFNTNNDARYILNQLYVKDYLVFLQKCKDEDINDLCNNLVNINITKQDLNLELNELEEAAELVQQEETEIMENEMALRMASMSLLPGLKKNNVVIVEESDDYESTSYESSSESSEEILEESSDESSSDSSEESSEELDSDDERI